MKHYLDYNATAPLRPEVLAVMQELQGAPLNPSSVHADGRRAKSIIEDARRTIAEIIGAFANEAVFTASGTEANNWVLRSFTDRPLIISAIEHSSVFKTAHALARPSILPVTPEGVVDMAALEKNLPRSGSFLASVMLANNETGVVQPVRAIADVVHASGGLLHCDAVQAFGKIPVNFSDLGCDLMTLSAHKMGGPVGAGVLVVRNNLAIQPMLIGGGQELNRRAGTENIAAIAGFAKAAEHIDFYHMKKLRLWLEGMEEELENISGVREGAKKPVKASGDDPAGEPTQLSIGWNEIGGGVPPTIIGKSAVRLPNTSCITMPNVVSETQLISFDLDGIAVSAGSACSSGRIESSHVLRAMGFEDLAAATAIRISGGWATTDKDIDAATIVWKKLFASKNPASK